LFRNTSDQIGHNKTTDHVVHKTYTDPSFSPLRRHEKHGGNNKENNNKNKKKLTTNQSVGLLKVGMGGGGGEEGRMFASNSLASGMSLESLDSLSSCFNSVNNDYQTNSKIESKTNDNKNHKNHHHKHHHHHHHHHHHYIYSQPVTPTSKTPCSVNSGSGAISSTSHYTPSLIDSSSPPSQRPSSLQIFSSDDDRGNNNNGNNVDFSQNINIGIPELSPPPSSSHMAHSNHHPPPSSYMPYSFSSSLPSSSHSSSNKYPSSSFPSFEYTPSSGQNIRRQFGSSFSTASSVVTQNNQIQQSSSSQPMKNSPISTEFN
jgi:hypothetical protein